MSKRSSICRFGILCVALLVAVPSFAASVLSMSPAGSGVFVLRGSGLVDTAIIDVELSYDSSSLTNPRIVQGNLISGAMTAANVDVPGVVRLSFIPTRSISGNGTIATISFDKAGTAPGRINTLHGRITNTAGNELPLSFSVDNPPEVSSGNVNQDDPQITAQLPTQPSGQSPTQVTGGGAQYPFVAGGNLTLPTDEAGPKDRKPQAPQEPAKEMLDVAAAPSGEPSSKDAARVDPPKVAAESSAPEVLQSVLEQFRVFKGPHTVAALTALFETPAASKFRQDPAVVIADGKNTAKVTIQKIAGSHAPNFAFTSASAVSWDISGSVWLVETKPSAGAAKSSVSVLVDGTVHTFPLAVSPAANVDLDRSGTITEDDFRLFLKESGTTTAPRFDLNGDGKRDYVDDYIFTANYVAGRSATADKKSDGGKSTKFKTKE